MVHPAVDNILEPLFNKSFIFDSAANRIDRGNLFAIKRFEFFCQKSLKKQKAGKSNEFLLVSFRGWSAHAKWGNSHSLTNKISEAITNI
jgi:hypothetical protein